MFDVRPSKRILVVDDEIENLKALRRELRSWSNRRGLAVDVCESGEAAIEQLDEHDYAVVLTDNRMPGMSGTELVRKVGKMRPATVSMMLTGYTEKQDVEAALSSGIFSFLVKPWERENLRHEVEKAMNVHYMRKRHLRASEQMNEELRMAVEFQKHLLSVQLPERVGSIEPQFAQSAASRLGVTGDYLDIRDLNDGRYLVLLGDVSGHGLRTTFVSAMIKAVLEPQYFARVGEDVSASGLLSWLNTRVYEMTERFPDLFVAFSTALVDGKTGTVTVSSAGNPLPLRKRGHAIEPIDVYGVALGVNDEASYEERTVQLQPGEQIYLFTDGINLPTEGSDRLDRDDLFRAILETANGETIDPFIPTLQRFSGATELYDDVTVVRLSADSATPRG